MRAKPHWLLALLGLASLAGCGGTTFEEHIRACATPSGALSSEDAELPQLVRAVEQQRGLPLQLASGGAIPSESNAAVALAAIYSPALHLHLTPKLVPLIAHGAPAEKRDEFLKQNQELVQQTAAALDRPRCVFDIEYGLGFFASMRYLDDAALASRLVLLRARRSATNKKDAESLVDVLRSLRLCHALANERRVEARALAASLRHEAFDVVRDCFEVGLWRRPEAEQLYALLREELDDWPDDGRMLMGERATVLHAYEAIRAGMLRRLMTLQEYRELKSKSIAELENATPAEIDADEARYLQTMQRLIDATALSHEDRATEVDAAFDDLQQVRPLFAARLFMWDLSSAMETAAQDKTTVLAWTLALAASAELLPPPFSESPLTGKSLEVEQNSQRVEIYDGREVLVALPLLLR